MEDFEQKTSKFSGGLNIIMRLDDLWKDTHEHSRAGLYKLWNLDLDRVWLELTRDYDEEKDKEFKQIEAKFDSFDEQISNLGEISDTKKAGFKKITSEDINKRNKFYKILMNKQLFLARLENKLGKGTTYDEEEDEDLD